MHAGGCEPTFCDKMGGEWQLNLLERKGGLGEEPEEIFSNQ